MQEALESTTPLQRFVLLAVADLDAQGETPVRSFDVRDFCKSHAGDLDGNQLGGGVTRETVIRALSELEAAGLLEEDVVGDQSPVGKGRPAYSLADGSEAVLEELAADEHVGGLAASIRESAE